MQLENVKLILDIVATATVVFGVIITISKFIRKKIANYIVTQIDGTSPICYVTDSIKELKEHSKNIDEINNKLNKMTSRLEDGDEHFKEVAEQSKEVNKQLKELTKGQIRSEILRFIDNDPEEVKQVTMLYDKYKKLGGNSYIDLIFNKYIQSVEP